MDKAEPESSESLTRVGKEDGLFGMTNVIFDVRLVAEDVEFETVYKIDAYCAYCGFNLKDAPLDRWLAIGFPLTFKCPGCGNHIVVNFYDLDIQADNLISNIPKP